MCFARKSRSRVWMMRPRLPVGQYDLFCRPHKCTFLRPEIKFLEFIVGGGRQRVDPETTRPVQESLLRCHCRSGHRRVRPPTYDSSSVW